MQQTAERGIQDTFERLKVGETSQMSTEPADQGAQPPPGTLFFQCNICGELCTVELPSLARELRSCPKCSSSPRTRAVIRTLSEALFKENLILSEFPTRKDLKGLG